jgi:hypothetical protein
VNPLAAFQVITIGRFWVIPEDFNLLAVRDVGEAPNRLFEAWLQSQLNRLGIPVG